MATSTCGRVEPGEARQCSGSQLDLFTSALTCPGGGEPCGGPLTPMEAMWQCTRCRRAWHHQAAA